MLVSSIFSFSDNVFKGLLFQGHLKSGFCERAEIKINSPTADTITMAPTHTMNIKQHKMSVQDLQKLRGNLEYSKS